jgi:thioredoxin 1
MAEVTVNVNNFQAEVLESSLPVLVDFWATWCGPCRMLGPVIEELAKDKEGSLKVAKINVDENPELARQYRVRSIPTLLLFKNGELVKNTMGYQTRSQLEDFLA